MAAGRKRQPGEVRRRQIARAAIRVIGREGLQGFTTANVARAAGVSEANLYRHFRNKGSILESVIGEIESDLTGKIRRISALNAPAPERLRLAFGAHLDYIRRNPGVPRIVFSSEAVLAGGLKNRLLEFVTGYMSALSGIIENGKAEGSIPADVDPRAAATMLVGMVQLSAFKGVLSGKRRGAGVDAEGLWRLYSRCIAA